ncbi:MAG TPA: hypothetical protein ENN46_01770 [Candidatus Woesearchaeota archaeon]|nr:hypothetical protein [Candidatus Woesearchaeota archaeon]
MSLIRQSVQLGLGIIDLSKEQVEKFVKEATKDKELNTKKGREMVNKILRDSKETRKKIEKLINEKVEKVSKEKFATRKDIERIEAKLDALLRGKAKPNPRNKK